MADLIGTRLSHYTVMERLGVGGMGVVYRARDERLDREVAVKVLPAEYAGDAERLASFEREARAAGALDHPAILTVHDVGTHDGAPFLVTELIEGRSLRAVITGGELSSRAAVELAIETAGGLAAAHEHGIVHRDLKPENIYVIGDGRIKIHDFGLAELKSAVPVDAAESPAEARMSTPGTPLGTVGYMAPEQVSGREADDRADIFSFGVVLYEMLTGLSPFRRVTAADTLSAIVREDPPRMSDTTNTVPPSFDGVVRRCLAKRPDRRFSTADKLAAALSKLIEAPTPRRLPVGSRMPYRPMAFIPVIIAAALAFALLASMYRVLLRHGPPAAADASPPRIVVLPFENPGAAEDDIFADGVTDEVTSRLAAVKGLMVISHTSAMRYQENRPPLLQIGDELEVEYALVGSVRVNRSQSGGTRAAVTAQLIRVADDRETWAKSYDRKLEHISKVQSDIATRVAETLDVEYPETEVIGDDG